MITTKQSVNSSSINSLPMNFLTWQLLDRLLLFIKPIAEYAFGMHIGFAFGWLIGLCAGHFYVNHFEPLYLNDLYEFAFWRAVPHIFARYGGLTGLVTGILTIKAINSKLLNQAITGLYEKGIRNPIQIARHLDGNLSKIEGKMIKLAKKGKISQNVAHEITSV